MASLADFTLHEVLGDGAFGCVRRCTRLDSGEQYAIKVVDAARAVRLGLVKAVVTERDVLIRLDGHPGVVKLFSTFRDDENLYIVLELATGGELFTHIQRLGTCNISCARWLTAELVNALQYIHEKQVIHRDLKPENILLDEAGHIKLCDFGSARCLDAAEPCTRFVGTAEYVSPEVLDDGEATAASDLWALGCILYQMLAGSPPFSAESEYLIFKRIQTLDLAFRESFHESARGLVSDLLRLSPAERIGGGGSYGEIKAHCFFNECVPPIDFDCVHTLPPPPLVPPPPMPTILGDSVENPQLAEILLEPEDRKSLMDRQASTRWARFLKADEIIILASAVLKRRHLSVKRRQLLLVDGPGECRIFYLDPDAMELRGEIPWHQRLSAELLPRGHFRVHLPWRTYYLEATPPTAELWVKTLLRLKAKVEAHARA